MRWNTTANIAGHCGLFAMLELERSVIGEKFLDCRRSSLAGSDVQVTIHLNGKFCQIVSLKAARETVSKVDW